MLRNLLFLDSPKLIPILYDYLDIYTLQEIMKYEEAKSFYKMAFGTASTIPSVEKYYSITPHWNLPLDQRNRITTLRTIIQENPAAVFATLKQDPLALAKIKNPDTAYTTMSFVYALAGEIFYSIASWEAPLYLFFVMYPEFLPVLAKSDAGKKMLAKTKVLETKLQDAIIAADSKQVGELLQLDRKLVDTHCSEKGTPLHIAVENEKYVIATEYLLPTSDVTTRRLSDSLSPMHLLMRNAAGKPNVLNVFIMKIPLEQRGKALTILEQYPSVLDFIFDHAVRDSWLLCPDQNGEFIIHRAARRGDLNLIAKLLQLYPTFYSCLDAEGKLPLFHAFDSAKIETTKFLIKCMQMGNFSLNQFGKFGNDYPQIVIAIVKRKLVVAKQLESCGASINLRHPTGKTLVEFVLNETSNPYRFSYAVKLIAYGAEYTAYDVALVDYALQYNKSLLPILYAASKKAGQEAAFLEQLKKFTKPEDLNFLNFLLDKNIFFKEMLQFIVKNAQLALQQITPLEEKIANIVDIINIFQKLTADFNNILKVKKTHSAKQLFYRLKITPHQAELLVHAPKKPQELIKWIQGQRFVCTSWVSLLEKTRRKLSSQPLAILSSTKKLYA